VSWGDEARQMRLSSSSLRPIRNYLDDPFKFVQQDYPIEIQKFYQVK